jgi:hypothetical protein
MGEEGFKPLAASFLEHTLLELNLASGCVEGKEGSPPNEMEHRVEGSETERAIHGRWLSMLS